MTRTERIKRKRVVKRNFTLAGIFCAIMILSLVSGIVFLAPIENDFHLALFFCGAVLVPLMVGLWFTLMGSLAKSELTQEFARFNDVRNKFRFRMFYSHIVQQDLDEARKAFNLIAMRDDGFRIFAHGMLITMMRLYGDTKDVLKAEERMNDILN
jgi:hypothetical protein